MSNILIVDDEQDIVNALEIYLKPEGYTIYQANTGKQAIRILQETSIHLVLMDIMMPELDGIQATSQIRSFSNVPIILLTAKSEDTDKVLGLNIGADDYITKPFNPAEVIARVRSCLRRFEQLGGLQVQTDIYKNGSIVLDDLQKKVTVDGEEVSLTPMEYGILKLFLQNPKKVFSSKEIYEKVWNETMFASKDTVAVHIRHLREKIEINPSEPRYISVVWGQGYRMEEWK